jgi:xanthine dehydrogenase accessory factor
MHPYWPESLHRALSQAPGVLVTVIAIKGSAPRTVGARMLITADGQLGSIGGGNLEYEATLHARDLMRLVRSRAQEKIVYGLGPKLNQCCGGAVTLLFECLPDARDPWLQELQSQLCRSGHGILVTEVEAGNVRKWLLQPGSTMDREVPLPVREVGRDYIEDDLRGSVLLSMCDVPYLVEAPRDERLRLVLFGAGHVGTELARMVPALPLRLHWIDSRAEQFPDWAETVAEVTCTDNPAAEVPHLPSGSLCLVMTHSHELDEELCHAILEWGEAAWLGLIGSASKRQRFVHRLAKRGVSEQQLERLVCPVGVAGIRGKRPATIAFSIAAQLLQDHVPAHWL